MEQFKLGESVTVINGPFKGIYGVIVFYDKQQEKYLIRFSGQQQLYYSANEIILWSEK
ncbi:transcription termination/antitermination protein NusG [Enterococcus pingfangensis]|uniref:KOW motif-containing protein n=1 Tax=Enterococcus pingfangensis TaxID=2559924 RepID=UPI0014858F85|nr:KOW motif-containing protein [Enterococcus pingfangensis]